MTIAAKVQRAKPLQTRPYRWTRQEYERMTEIGLFSSDARLELIEGEILEMAAHTSYHAAALAVIQRWLDRNLGVGYHVRVQLPLALADDSEPEPDVAVVTGNPEDYWHRHPPSAELVIKIAYSSLEYDQERKRRLYARALLAEYWILNLSERSLEVYREPQAGDYLLHLTLRAGDKVAPLIRPDQQVEIAAFLPH